MATLINLILIILGFGLLIFIHELGHFVAAKWAGIRTEAFAIGMGHAVISWRKGIGLRIGSTEKEVLHRVRSHCAASGFNIDDDAASELRTARIHRAMDELGLGETEYSLRWLPIGGFVKMLGQDDANPTARSADPRSYNMRPIGKRMIVVSAGVIMNLVLAALLFIFVFLAGVRFEAPVIGDVTPEMPAALAGIKPGDIVTQIDSREVVTFADVQIATAMSRPDSALRLSVKREGESEPMQFTLTPQHDPRTGLLGIGVAPAASNILLKDSARQISQLLDNAGLLQQGVQPGMTLISADGQSIQRYKQFQDVVSNSNGRPVHTRWERSDPASRTPVTVDAVVDVMPQYARLIYPTPPTETGNNFEFGLLGFVPLTKVASVERASVSSLLRPNDVILRAGKLNAPKFGEFLAEVKSHARRQINLKLLRDGEVLEVDVPVNRNGTIGIGVASAIELPLFAEPMSQVRRSIRSDAEHSLRTLPIAPLRLGGLGGSRILRVNDTPVSDWASFREALRLNTKLARDDRSPAVVNIVIQYSTPGREVESLPLQLAVEDVDDLHALGWLAELDAFMFDEIHVIRSASGNPLRAIVMGIEETHKLVMMTYLTIDRLIRGSVGVEQLRGPVGIVHFGAQIADRGVIYLIFLLAVISVNLAVINFLPLPIVDGGLFLFLIYEKFKGRPPSVAFQNAATIVGLCLIGTMFLVVTWNDVMRLIG